MKRQITGSHAADRCAADQVPDGIFLVRVHRVQFRRQGPKPYYTLALAIIEPSRFAGCTLSGRLYCSPKALWKLNWFLRDLGYDTELLGRDEVDEAQLVGLTGVVKISHIIYNDTSLLRLDGFAPRWPLGRTFSRKPGKSTSGGLMTYSYTRIGQYLTCPRRYRHRYLDGWKEKDTRAAMLFGRAFERALGALFRREDPGAVLFAEWSACQGEALHYSNRDSWDRMLQQGILLLTRLCQDGRVQVTQPERNLQIEFRRPMGDKNDFVAYIDAIGTLDGKRCLIEWKTSSSRYPEEPEGLLSLDPQLVCYSWITGIAEVAQVVFVRKSLVEVQYLRTNISDEQREQFGNLAEGTIRGSSRRTFCHTVASGFRRIPVRAVRM